MSQKKMAGGTKIVIDVLVLDEPGNIVVNVLGHKIVDESKDGLSSQAISYLNDVASSIDEHVQDPFRFIFPKFIAYAALCIIGFLFFFNSEAIRQWCINY
ncbi:MAG: hypothetical protein GWN62_08690 [Aliifodinibius sp.]|nr:hypothetical protein [Fodinibius sp.]